MTGIFERKEQKYLLTAGQRRMLEKILLRYMKEDEYGESIIRNVYFDTDTGILVRRSLEKPVYKEKLRIRSYKKTGEEDKVFLELKKKYKGIVYKRRIEVKENAFYDYLEGKREFPERGQIADEIDYFCRFYQTIQPRIYLSYERCAYFGINDDGLRITFDRNIRWRTDRLSLSCEAGGEDILAEGMSLMEIKAANAMPLWLVDQLNALKIRQTSFSKYGNAYKSYISEKGEIRYA